MTAASFAIAVTIEVKPENTDDFRNRILRQAQDSLKKEPWCLGFEVLQDTARPNVFFLFESYTDAEALDRHRATDHFADYSSTVEAWITAKDIRRLNYSRPDTA